MVLKIIAGALIVVALLLMNAIRTNRTGTAAYPATLLMVVLVIGAVVGGAIYASAP